MEKKGFQRTLFCANFQQADAIGTDKDMIMRKMIALASVVMLMAVFKTTAYAFPSVVTETWRSNFTKGEVPDDDQPEMVEKLTDLFLEPVTQEEEEEE